MRRQPVPERDRRKLFRRMEWVFVYAPPALAAFVGIFGAVFFAWIVPIPGTTFWGRWALAVLVILVLPTVVYVVRERLRK